MPRFDSADGLNLHYTDEGEGPGAPLLCLPGLTRNGRDFDRFAPHFTPERRVVRLDSRGRGGSERDPEPMNYNVKIEADDALALLGHLGVDRAVIVGSSRGGLLAMAMAAARPERIAGVVLNDVGPELDPAGLSRIGAYVGVPPSHGDREQAAAAMKAAQGAQFPTFSDADWLALAERSFDVGEGGLALNYDPKLREAIAAQMAAAGEDGPDLWPLFSALGPIPTLVLRGANSDVLGREAVARMQAEKPDLMVAEIPDRGHIPRLDEPEALAAIRALLVRVDA